MIRTVPTLNAPQCFCGLSPPELDDAVDAVVSPDKSKSPVSARFHVNPQNELWTKRAEPRRYVHCAALHYPPLARLTDIGQ